MAIYDDATGASEAESVSGASGQQAGQQAVTGTVLLQGEGIDITITDGLMSGSPQFYIVPEGGREVCIVSYARTCLHVWRVVNLLSPIAGGVWMLVCLATTTMYCYFEYYDEYEGDD